MQAAALNGAPLPVCWQPAPGDFDSSTWKQRSGMDSQTVATLGTCAAAMLLLAVLLTTRRRFVGLTLLSPWAWAVASSLLIGAAALISQNGAAAGRSIGHSPIWYIAGMSTFCPTMAVLGAKRPQVHAWQWVIVSLWVILSLPAFEWWLFHDGHPREMHLARSFFLGLLVVIGIGNMLFTRYALAAIIFGMGQLALIGPFVFSERWPLADMGPLANMGPLIGALAMLAAAATAMLAARFGRSPTWPLNRVWIDYRDLYGAVWAVRQMDRFNATAKQNGWNVELTWQGFEGPAGESINHLSPQTEAELYDTLRSLLLRFVSSDWIAERIAGRLPTPNTPVTESAHP